MIFDFIKRIFSSDNTQIDSIIMTDPKDLDYSSAEGIEHLLDEATGNVITEIEIVKKTEETII